MVEHLVLFKLKPETTAGQRRAMIDALKRMRPEIPQIVEMSCGENFSQRNQGYEIGLMVRFADRAGLDAYLPHPAHRSVVEQYIHPISDGVIVVDYEF